MEKKVEEVDITKKCWNSMENIENKKNENIKAIYQYFHDINVILKDFNKAYKNMKINIWYEERIVECQDYELNELTNSFDKTIIKFISMTQNMVENVNNKFQDMAKVLKEAEEKKEEHSTLFQRYKNRKVKMEKFRNAFREKMEILEKSLMEEKTKGVKVEKKSRKKLISEIVSDYLNYNKEITGINKFKNEIDDGKKALFLCYNKIIQSEPSLFVKVAQDMVIVAKTLSSNFNQFLEKLQVFQSNFNESNYIKKTIESFQSDGNDDDNEILNYYIKYNPYLSFRQKNRKVMEDAINLRDDIIASLKQSVRDAYPNPNIDIQEGIVELPNIIESYLNAKLEMTKDNQKKILDLMKNDYSIYPQILIILNRHRSNSKLYNSKEHILFLGDILNEILLSAEELVDFSSVKNCIILSQTYYYRDEKTKKKMYLVEGIRKNKWLNSEEFWREFVDNQIRKELCKFESLKNINLDLKGEIKIPKEHSEKIKEIVFASLITYLTNMKDFNLGKKAIIQIIDNLIVKFNCTDPQRTKNLFMILSPDPKEIEEIRNSTSK